ncbi:hypothetical protein [Bacillus bombysepticus]|uniref:hypothetical protein n=1 Tax=Bacillus bombysepticus TaxID=658666 RepID=UPI003017AD79
MRLKWLEKYDGFYADISSNSLKMVSIFEEDGIWKGVLSEPDGCRKLPLKSSDLEEMKGYVELLLVEREEVNWIEREAWLGEIYKNEPFTREQLEEWFGYITQTHIVTHPSIENVCVFVSPFKMDEIFAAEKWEENGHVWYHFSEMVLSFTDIREKMVLQILSEVLRKEDGGQIKVWEKIVREVYKV